jgi:hypothetical protein
VTEGDRVDLHHDISLTICIVCRRFIRGGEINLIAILEEQLDTLSTLLQKLEDTREGSPELDVEIKKVFPSTPDNVTRSIDAVARLIETELPGWWWWCGYCKASNDASLYPPGSSRHLYCSSSTTVGPDGRSGPEAEQLINDPKWGKIFDAGFHLDLCGGSMPLAMLRVFLTAKITLAQAQKEGLQPLSSVKRVPSSVFERLMAGEKMTEPTRIALEKMKKAELTGDELALIMLDQMRRRREKTEEIGVGAGAV